MKDETSPMVRTCVANINERLNVTYCEDLHSAAADINYDDYI